MAYNPALYGNYPYGNQYGQQQPVVPQQTAPAYRGIDWVDGESEARSRQLPPGVIQHDMWDINEPIIYIKSLNQYGMPNPLRKIRYTMDETQSAQANAATANLMSGNEKPDMSDYVRRDELEKLNQDQFVRKDEFKQMADELMQSIREIGTTTAKKPVKGETA